MPLCLTLPAPNPYKHGLFTDDAATEGMGPEEAASAEQILIITSVMDPLCLFPVNDQPSLGFGSPPQYFSISAPPHPSPSFFLGSDSAALDSFLCVFEHR